MHFPLHITHKESKPTLISIIYEFQSYITTKTEILIEDDMEEIC